MVRILNEIVSFLIFIPVVIIGSIGIGIMTFFDCIEDYFGKETHKNWISKE